MFKHFGYIFKTQEFQDEWDSIIQNKYDYMELYYRKKLSMNALLSIFRKAFHIAPITLKTSNADKHYRYKLLAIYLLSKYSKETFENIAEEFNTAYETVDRVSSDELYRVTFKEDIKSFFKECEDDYLAQQKSSLAWKEQMKFIEQKNPNFFNELVEMQAEDDILENDKGSK